MSYERISLVDKFYNPTLRFQIENIQRPVEQNEEIVVSSPHACNFGGIVAYTKAQCPSVSFYVIVQAPRPCT